MSRLHWYGPRSHPRGGWYVGMPPYRRARYRLYHADVAEDGTWIPTDEWVWIGTDCGWEWLATRPVINRVGPLRRLFDHLHDHVHTPGSW